MTFDLRVFCAAAMAMYLVAGSPAADAKDRARPWKSGEPPPAVQGVELGNSCARVIELLGKPDEEEEQDGQAEFKYHARGLTVACSDKQGVLFIGYGNRESGDIGGVRVGDRLTDVIARWGKPDQGGALLTLYKFGNWQVAISDWENKITGVGIAVKAVREARPAAPVVEETEREGEAPLAGVLAGDATGLVGKVSDGHYVAADGSFRVKIPQLDAPDASVADRLLPDDVGVRFFAESTAVNISASRGPKYLKTLRDLAEFYVRGGREKKAVAMEEIDTKCGPGIVLRYEDTYSCLLPGPERHDEARYEGCPARFVTYFLRCGGNDYHVGFVQGDMNRPGHPETHIVGGRSLEEVVREMFESLEVFPAR